MPAVNGTNTTEIRIDVKPGGWHHEAIVRVILDPAERRVFDWSNVGSGVPEPVWHGRMRTLAIVSPSVDADALDERLRSPEVQEALRALCDAYLGAEWDDSNLVGRWALGEDEEAYLDERWETLLADLPTFWDADDWFSSTSGGAVSDALDAEDLDAWIEGEVENARVQGVLLSESGVRDWILDRFERVAIDDRAEVTKRWAAASALDARGLAKDAVAEARALGAWHVYDVGGDVWQVENDPIALDNEAAFLAFVDDVREQVELAYEKAGVCVELRSWDGRVARQMGLTWDVPEEES